MWCTPSQLLRKGQPGVSASITLSCIATASLRRIQTSTHGKISDVSAEDGKIADEQSIAKDDSVMSSSGQVSHGRDSAPAVSNSNKKPSAWLALTKPVRSTASFKLLELRWVTRAVRTELHSAV